MLKYGSNSRINLPTACVRKRSIPSTGEPEINSRRSKSENTDGKESKIASGSALPRQTKGWYYYGGGIGNRTYDIHKNLYIEPFLLTIFGPVNYGPPY